jgi:hypothetical protein
MSFITFQAQSSPVGTANRGTKPTGAANWPNMATFQGPCVGPAHGEHALGTVTVGWRAHQQLASGRGAPVGAS